MTTRTEHRALIRYPASVLASAADRARGYTEEWTKPGSSREAVRRSNYALSRPEESLVGIVKWQTRTITAGPWQDAPDTPTPTPPPPAAAPASLDPAAGAALLRETATYLRRIHAPGLVDLRTLLADLEDVADRTARGLTPDGTPRRIVST